MGLDASRKLSFQPFDEQGEVRIYYNGFLPHWRQTGCTYFVTWRLADSIPAGVLRQWKFERMKWLEARAIDQRSKDWMKTFRKLPGNDQKVFQRNFVSKFFTKLDEGIGRCVLRDPIIAKEALSAVLFFDGNRIDVGDTVVMPNHIHSLITPRPGFELEDILHSIKSYSSNQLQRSLGISGKLWMEESHDHIVRDGEELLRIQKYIRSNPEKAKLKIDEYMLHTAEYDLSAH